MQGSGPTWRRSPLTLIPCFEENEFVFSRCAAAGDLGASSTTWNGVVNGFLINLIHWLHHDVYPKLPFDLRCGVRICINRGGIPPLEHISFSYILHLINILKWLILELFSPTSNPASSLLNYVAWWIFIFLYYLLFNDKANISILLYYFNHQADFQKLSFFVYVSLQKDYEESAATVITIVDCVVNKTRVFFFSFFYFSISLHIQFLLVVWEFYCIHVCRRR